jgi:parallel beta-helix repeat protein
VLKYLLVIAISTSAYLGHAQVVINELVASNLNSALDQMQEADDWFELYNTTNQAVDISGWKLSDDFLTPNKWNIPSGTIISANGFLLFWADNDVLQGSNHSNFKLSAGGEQLILSNALGSIIDSLSFGPQQTDISYGRTPDGANPFGYFTTTTPGLPNNDSPALSVTTSTPVFSKEAGFYSTSIEVGFSNSVGIIHYTTNGQEPTENSQIYSSPLTISQSTVLRARVIEINSLPGSVITKSYFINENFEVRDLPVISLATDENYFYQKDTGIYVQNYKPEWEYPVNIEFFEKNGTLGFNEGAGVKILGERSWVIPQKMLGITFKSKFGSSKLNYQLFPELPIQTFEGISLRASGSDWGKTFFRDGLQQAVTQPNMKTIIQGFRPAIVFLNGKYLGIHNIRTRTNEDYYKERYQISDTDFEMVENHGEVIAGTNFFYNQWYNYIDNNNFFNPPVYDYVKTMMDIDNFIDYMVTWMFSANVSWGEGNIAMMRSRDGGKWKWITLDFDRGFENINYPNFEFFTEKNNPGQNNPLWASLPLRKLLKNQDFENRFIQRFADNLYTTYHPITLSAALTKFKNNIDQEIDRHGQRWGDSTSIHGDGIKDFVYWQASLDVMQSFINQRNDIIADNLINNFSSLTSQIQLDLNTFGNGQIVINEHPVPKGNWSGNYFNNRTVTLTAIPDQGQQFAYWQNVSGDSLSINISVSLSQDTNINAVFTANENAHKPLVINEIKFENADGFATDWIELYNPNNFPINIANWSIKEKTSGLYYQVEGNTWIEANGYFVVSANQNALQKDYPSLVNHSGNLPFGLSNISETILLLNNNKQLIDEVSYSQINDWPKVLNNTNQSIQLISADLDNNKGKNWGTNNSNTIGAPNQFLGFRLTDVSNQFVNAGDFFDAINLDNFLISTTWPKSSITWTTQYGSKVNVVIVDSIATLSYPTGWTGLDSVKFTATNPDMVSVSDVAYFGVGTVINKPDCKLNFDAQNSPYFLPNGLNITDVCSLSISEGVTLYTGHHQDIEIQGLLTITGSKTNPVTFKAIDREWGALKLKSANDTVVIDYALFTQATYSKTDSTYFNAAVSVNHSILSIANSTFENNRRCIYSKHASVHINNCLFKTSNRGEKVNLQFTNAITENSTFEYTYGDNDGLDYDAVFNGIIRNNMLLGGEDDGIDIGQIDGVACQNVLIENNVSKNFKDKAISVGEESQNITIKRNLLLNCNSGIAVKDASTAIIQHNTINGNKIGIACYEKHEGFGGSYATVLNCIISNSDTLAFFSENSSELTVSYSLVYPQAFVGEAIIQQAPDFSNLQDFELSETSPAIDRGKLIDQPDNDGTLPDLGAKYFEQINLTEDVLRMYPNPAIENVTIDLKLKPTQEVLITLASMSGNQIDQLVLQPNDFNILGRASINLSHFNLAAGTYLITVFYDNTTTSGYLTLLRDE